MYRLSVVYLNLTLKIQYFQQLILCFFFQLEQIELEVRAVSGSSRNHLKLRVESHRAELKRLSQEFQNSLNPNNQQSPDDESWENIVTEDQKRRLLDTSEKIERTGKNLQNGYSIALETEEIGTQVLRDLHEQRETIQRGRGRVS